MKLAKNRRWFQIKIQKSRDYYKKFGLYKFLLNSLELRGIVFKRELIFWEKELCNAILHKEYTDYVDFVKINKNNPDPVEFQHEGVFIAKEEVFRRLSQRDCTFFILKIGSKIVCYQFIEFNLAYIPFFRLLFSIPSKSAYSSTLYTLPEFRRKGFALRLNLLVQQYLKDRGYQKVFVLTEMDNVPAQKVHEKAGFRKYQTVVYRGFFFLKYYVVMDCKKNISKSYWHLGRTDHKIWKTFSKIADDQNDQPDKTY